MVEREGTGTVRSLFAAQPCTVVKGVRPSSAPLAACVRGLAGDMWCDQAVLLLPSQLVQSCVMDTV